MLVRAPVQQIEGYCSSGLTLLSTFPRAPSSSPQALRAPQWVGRFHTGEATRLPWDFLFLGLMLEVLCSEPFQWEGAMLASLRVADPCLGDAELLRSSHCNQMERLIALPNPRLKQDCGRG